MAKSTHTSAAPRKQSTKPTPLPTRAKITNNQEKEESSSLFEVKSSESNVEFSDMPTSQPKKTDNNNTKKSEKKNEEIVKPVEKLDKKSEPVKIAKKMKDCNQGIQITKSLQLEFMNLENKSKPQKPPEDSLVQQLRESLADSSFFNETKYNKDGDINSIFSYHPVSFKLLLNYPKIIFLDSPANYKKYQMHLIHIAGLGENNEQFSIAFSFISTRSTPSYAWTLQQIPPTIHHKNLPKIPNSSFHFPY
ncbi:hypothetical protein PSTT_06913, partial [Puccinia striiformis]